MKTFTRLQQELQEASKRSVSRQKTHYDDGRSIAGISAYRGERSDADNKKAHRELAKRIRKSGHGFVKSDGTYPEHNDDGTQTVGAEPSYIIHSKDKTKKGHVRLKKLARRLAQDYDQESFMLASKKHGSRLHGTKKRVWPGKGGTAKVGVMHPGKGGDYHTRMVQPKQKFSFQEPKEDKKKD